MIDNLGPKPPQLDARHTPDTLREMTRVYHEVYVPVLGAFFETQ